MNKAKRMALLLKSEKAIDKLVPVTAENLKKKVKPQVLTHEQIAEIYDTHEHEFIAWDLNYRHIEGSENECRGGRTANSLIGYILYLENKLAEGRNAWKADVLKRAKS